MYAIEYQFWGSPAAEAAPTIEVLPAPPIEVSPIGDPLFGLDEDGVPAGFIVLWIAGAAITLGVIALGVVLAVRAGRGVERVTTKYIERKYK